MEDPEVPLEESQEHIQHHAEHNPEGRRWVLGVALSSAIFAALAAVASLRAGYHANEALMAQIDANNEILKESDQWTYYQAKGIKAAVIAARIEFQKSLDKAPSDADTARLKHLDDEQQRYGDEQKEITAKATEFQEHANRLKEDGRTHLEHHEKLATAVTMFQICIAISAISVLTGRKQFWWVSLLAGAAGVFFMMSGLFIH